MNIDPVVAIIQTWRDFTFHILFIGIQFYIKFPSSLHDSKRVCFHLKWFLYKFNDTGIALKYVANLWFSMKLKNVTLRAMFTKPVNYCKLASCVFHYFGCGLFQLIDRRKGYLSKMMVKKEEVRWWGVWRTWITKSIIQKWLAFRPLPEIFILK